MYFKWKESGIASPTIDLFQHFISNTFLNLVQVFFILLLHVRSFGLASIIFHFISSTLSCRIHAKNQSPASKHILTESIQHKNLLLFKKMPCSPS
ncbi:Hypothetical protein GbCGDNIH6_7075 [Granulibacter bethesdensis]|nr:Hypothetical protein GbCGDNIH6_7075 [Granulibacter bethesdensis]